MRLLFYIPTYFARPTTEGYHDGDVVYDHPTPVDTDGTLQRTLESFLTLKDSDWSIILGVAATTPAVLDRARGCVRRILRALPHALQGKIHMMSEGGCTAVQSMMRAQRISCDKKLFSFRGYSAVRNGGLLAGILTDADVIVMVDDDQIFEDSDFVGKVREGAAVHVDGHEILGWSGYCPEANRSYIRVRPWEPWMQYWDKIGAQNKTYEKIIGVREPRWKVTPIAFGGCFLVKRELFSTLPFDPNVFRGEDMDYCMNARMFGTTFYLDNQLAMTHLPPPRTHPQWRRVREDMVRYLYQREKLRRQTPLSGMTHVLADDFDPYPGVFLKDDLDMAIEKANTILALEYREKGDQKSAEEALQNITIARTMQYAEDPFQALVHIRHEWEQLVTFVTKNKEAIQQDFFDSV